MFARSIAIAVCSVSMLLISGCAPYSGSARPIDPASVSEPGWLDADGVPLVRQHRHSDCGAAAMAMVASFWNGPTTANDILAITPSSSRGIRARHLRAAALKLGLRAYLLEGSFRDLEHELAAGRPVVVGLIKPHGRKSRSHYEVVVAIHPARKRIVTLDPAAGWRENSFEGFVAEWQPAKRTTLVVLPGARRVAAAPPVPVTPGGTP
jgi:ABC-type bacteriocin/lantibiotic exporter with double-glycine peptidase domain